MVLTKFLGPVPVCAPASQVYPPPLSSVIDELESQKCQNLRGEEEVQTSKIDAFASLPYPEYNY